MFVVPSDPRHVIVQKLALIVDKRPDIELDLTNLGIALYLQINDSSGQRMQGQVKQDKQGQVKQDKLNLGKMRQFNGEARSDSVG